MSSPVTIKQSYSIPTANSLVSLSNSPTNLAESKNSIRRSSFASSSSPWFRRNSFLSESMINDEKHSVYESSNWCSDGLLTYNISLKESQGFVWNQDLFASPYQQSRSLFNERRYRESFSSSHNDSNSLSHSQSNSLRFNNSSNSDIEDNADDDMNDDDYEFENDDDRRMNYKVEVTEIILKEDELDDLFPSDD